MIRKAKHLFYPFGAAVHCFLCRNRITAIAGRNQNGSNSPATFLSSARIFIFCGQRFSHAPHSLHKLANGGWAGSRPLYSYIGSSPFFSGWRPHCMPQNKRDIHPIGAGHAIAAGRGEESGKEERNALATPSIYRLFFRPNGAGQRISGHLHILRKLLSCAHPTEHNRNLRLIPNPPQPPIQQALPPDLPPETPRSRPAQILRQPAAQQRLHNDHGQPALMRLLQPAAPCLIIFIDIVILDLAKIPIICLQQLGELLLPTVIGKPDRPGCGPPASASESNPQSPGRRGDSMFPHPSAYE